MPMLRCLVFLLFVVEALNNPQLEPQEKACPADLVYTCSAITAKCDPLIMKSMAYQICSFCLCRDPGLHPKIKQRCRPHGVQGKC